MADELVKAGAGTMQKRQAFVDKRDLSGTEDITSADLRLPRLAIAQGLSSQIVPDSSDYIKGLSMYDLFNDLTGEIYGRGPVKFIVVKREVRRIEFDPDNRGVPLDLNVPIGDPRTEWTTNESTGEREAPRATKFTEFVILLIRDNHDPEPIVMSIKDTNRWNRKTSERLTGFIKFRPPIYSNYYEVTSKSEKNDQGTFGIYVVKQAGALDDQSQSDEQWDKSVKLYHLAKEFRESLSGKTISIQREREFNDDGADDFEVDEDGNLKD